MEKQFRSRQHITEHGEVFTARREVKAMCDLVADECIRIDSRFLEPACGDGNFLCEILTRKLDVVTRRYKKNPYDYERNALLALGSLYGVELLEENVLACRERLFELWDTSYRKAVQKRDQNDDVRASAKYILKHNILCGNARTLCLADSEGNDTPEPIIFSQWAFATGPMMKREDYTFAELLRAEPPQGQEGNGVQLSLDLRENPGEEGTLIRIFPPVHYRRLWEYG